MLKFAFALIVKGTFRFTWSVFFSRLIWRSTFRALSGIYVLFCAIWYYLYNLKNVKNAHGGVLLLHGVTLSHRCFSRFLNFTNGTKSRKTAHIYLTEIFFKLNMAFTGSYFFSIQIHYHELFLEKH